MTVAAVLEIAKMADPYGANYMQIMSAKDVKRSLRLLMDRARSEPVQVEQHGRPVVVVVSAEEFQRRSLMSENFEPVAELHSRTGG